MIISQQRSLLLHFTSTVTHIPLTKCFKARSEPCRYVFFKHIWNTLSLSQQNNINIWKPSHTNDHLKTLHKNEQQQKIKYLPQFCHSHNSPYINAKKSHVLHHCRLIANHNTRVISLSLNSIISAAKNAKRHQVFTPTMKEFRSERTSSSWSSSRPRNSSQKVIVVIWAIEKKKKTFHCGCLIGVLIMVENIIPHNWVMYNIPLTTRLFIAHMNGHQDVVVLRGFFQVQKYNTLQPLGRLDVQLSDRQHRRCRVAFLSSITKSYQVSEEHTSKQKTQPKHVILANSGISKYC